jgi:hypothetical protein
MCFQRKLHIRSAGYDAGRSHEIEDHGLAVLRFTNSDVLDDLDAVKLRILDAAGLRPALSAGPSPLRERGSEPHPSAPLPTG